MTDGYQIRVVDQIQGRSIIPRYYIDGPYRSFRASSRTDAEYLATALNSLTDEQQMAALDAGAANYLEAAE